VIKKNKTPEQNGIQEIIGLIEHIASEDLKIRRKKTDKNDPMNEILKALAEFKTLDNNKDQTKETSLESTQILGSLLKHTPAGIAVLEGPEFRYVSINQKLAELNGLSVKDHLGKPLKEVLPHAAEDLLPVLRKIMKTGKAVSSREFSIALPKDSGKTVHLIDYLFPIPDRHGRPMGIGAIVFDITHRKGTEKGLQQLALAAATVGDGITITDTDGMITFANAAIEKMLDYKRGELIGNHVSSLYEGGSANPVYQEIMEDVPNGSWKGEVSLCKKNGDLIPTLENASPLTEDGQLQGFVCTNTDITNLKLAEDKIRQYSKKLEEQVEMRTRALIEEIEEHEDTLNKLETQKVYFENLFHSSPDAIAILDKSDRIIQVNKSFEKIFEYYEDEIKGNRLNELIVPHGLKGESKKYTKEIANGRTVNFESIRQTKGGYKIDVSVVGSPIIFNKNQQAIYVIYRDISSRKKALMKLQESEDRYRSLYTKTKAMLYSIDINGEIIAVSNYWLRKLGYKRSEVIGKQSLDFLTKESKRYAVNVALPEFMKRGYADDISYQFVKKNGEIMDTLLSAVAEFDPEGKFKRSFAVLNDVTKRLRAEIELRKSEQNYRRLVDKAADAIYILQDRKFIFVNPAFEKLFGYTLQETSAADFDYMVVVAPESRELILQRNGAREEIPSIYEMKAVSKSGDIIDLHINTVPIEYKGRPAIQGIMRDITEIKRFEAMQQELSEKFERAERMESLGLLAGGVAHDLNNIIGPIMAYPELIKMSLSEGLPVDEDLDAISSSARRAADVISDLLALTRRGNYKMKPIDLNDLVNDYLNSADYKSIIKSYPEVIPDIQLSEDSLLFKGSQAHLPKVISNLINNGFESMPEGGMLSIRSSSINVENGDLSIRNIPPGRYNLLTIEDQGEGIDEKNISKIFDPFFSTKIKTGKSGTGLGLSVVYNVLKDHGAHIDVKSNLGKGTKFSIYFPETTEKKGTATKVKLKGKGNGGILVVDDRKEQREMAKRLLSKLGYDVESVESGQEAVKYLKKKNVDLVLLDMILKEDMDGLDTFKEIIKIKPGQKAIIVSGYSESERVKEAEELGVVGFISKPYKLDDIGESISRVLGEQN